MSVAPHRPVRRAADAPSEPQAHPGRPWHPGRLVALLAVVGAVLLAAGVVLSALAPPEPVGPTPRSLQLAVADLFDPDLEGNIWAWYSAMALLAVGAVFAVHAAVRRATRQAWPAFAVLAAVAVYLSADEAAHLHEELRHFVPEAFSGLGWVFFGAPLAIVAGVVLLLVARGLDRTLRRRLVLAGAVFLVGAAGLELVAYLTSARVEQPGLYLLLMPLEEGMELAGTLLALWAALAALDIRVGRDGVVLGPHPEAAAPQDADRRQHSVEAAHG